MVTDFQENNYNTVVSYYERTKSDAQDEMIVWVNDFITDLKAGIQRLSLRDAVAMSLYHTIVSNTGDPTEDNITYEKLRNVIHNFNLLTNSALDINYR